MRFTPRALLTALLLPLSILTACDSPLAPFEPEINAAQDNFQLQATGVNDVTSSSSWTWSNTGTRATVNHSTVTSAGNAKVVIRDAAGVVVYDHALEPSLNQPTAVGTAGTWTIRLQLEGFSGTLNFRVQKL